LPGDEIQDPHGTNGIRRSEVTGDR
jgi:hypothetical protein